MNTAYFSGWITEVFFRLGMFLLSRDTVSNVETSYSRACVKTLLLLIKLKGGVEEWACCLIASLRSLTVVCILAEEGDFSLRNFYSECICFSLTLSSVRSSKSANM